MFGAIEKSVLDKVVEQTERLTPPPSRTVTSVGKNSIIRSKHELENSYLEHEFNAEKKIHKVSITTHKKNELTGQME